MSFLNGLSLMTIIMNVLMCFPALLAAAALCERRPRLAAVIMVVFIALLFRTSAFFGANFFVG